jgi:hypothetical protein
LQTCPIVPSSTLNCWHGWRYSQRLSLSSQSEILVRQTISSHEALASMMAMPCMVPVSVKAVAAKKPTKGGRPIRERTIVYEGSSGPRELLEAIVIQARAALRGLESNKAPDSEPEEMTEEQKRMTNDTKGKAKEAQVTLPDEHLKLLNFCQRIVATANAIDRSLRETKGDAFVDRLHKSLPQIHTSSSSTVQVHAGATDATLSKVYVEWASRVRFEYCDLTVPTTSKNDEAGPEYMFFYNNEARALGHSDIPKRSLAIAKEVCSLQITVLTHAYYLKSWQSLQRICQWHGTHLSS